MRVQLWDRKDKGALWERKKKRTSNSSLDFCSVMDPGCKVVRKNVRSKYITVTIHQAGFHLALCVRAWGENNIKEEGSLLWNRKMWKCIKWKNKVTLCNKKIRVQYETKKNCTFNSSLALVLWHRLDRKVEGTLSDRKTPDIRCTCLYVC